MNNTSVDILSIDSEIREYFHREHDRIDKVKDNLSQLEEAERTLELKRRSLNNIKNAIENCKIKIKELEEQKEYNFYVANTLPLLEKYREKLTKPIVVSFCGKMNKTDPEKEEIIKEYLEISGKYLNHKEIQTNKDKKVAKTILCNNCDNKTSFDIYDNTVYICKVCFSEQNIMSHTSSYNDIDRVNISSKYMYDRRIHFRDCIKQYQGKQNSTIPTNIYEDLKREFEMHHLTDIKSDNIYHKITKNQILLFLKELGYANHYENVHLIHYTFTKIKPDDISHLEDKLMDDFDALTALYDIKYKGINRKNFINTQYVLYQLLQRHKHKCDKSQFVILKTVDRKFFHDEVCKTLFEMLGWNHKPSY